MGGFFAAYRQILARLFRLITLGQLSAASRANDYVSRVMSAQGFGRDALRVDPMMFAGIASDGRPLPTLLEGPPSTVAMMLGSGVDYETATQRGKYELARIVSTQVQDAGRTADGVATVSHGAEGYYRMLVPPSCSRCAILAGKFFRYNAGFERHPKCDCVHIPAAEADDDDLRLDPEKYFESLSQEEQDRIFTQSGAQAIRDGADMGQVVNARRGMRTASVGGRNIKATTEGVTKRGWHSYVQRAIDPNTEFVKTPESRYRRTSKPRLMPEQIYDLSREYDWDRDELMRQLVRNGYLTDVDAPGSHALERISNF